LVLPDLINATPERITEVVLQAKPKTRWRYLEKRSGETEADSTTP